MPTCAIARHFSRVSRNNAGLTWVMKMIYGLRHLTQPALFCDHAVNGMATRSSQVSPAVKHAQRASASFDPEASA